LIIIIHNDNDNDNCNTFLLIFKVLILFIASHLQNMRGH